MLEFTTSSVVTRAQSGGLADSVFENAESDPGYIALARRDGNGVWRDVTAARFRDEVMAVAKGLLAEGVRFGDRVALMSRTRYEWTLLDYALWTIGAQSVPVHPTASTEQVVWTLADADVSAAVVETEDHAMTIGAVVGRLPLLKRLWQLDAGAVEQLGTAGERIDDEVVNRHRMALTPDTVATVSYTAGTDGAPKACVLTHSNFMAQCDNIAALYRPLFSSGHKEEPATLLFLPLAHTYGRMVQVAALRAKVKLGHQPRTNTTALLSALKSFRPTYVLAVPRLFEEVFDRHRRAAEIEGRAETFEKAVEVAVQYAEATERKAFGEGAGPSARLRLQHQLMDRLVYAKLRAEFGGRLRHASCGGSSLGRRLGLFFDAAGLRIFEGYGLTEATSTVTANPPGHPRFGTVGKPIPGTTVRIADDGEIWVRGGQVFGGYLHDPANTAATLRDGWLATGDLGSLADDGYLTLTGRRQDLLVTWGGESLAPELLEERVRSHPLVSQCVVVGDRRPFMAALVTLEPEAVAHWLATHDKPALGPEALVNDVDLESEIRSAVVDANTLASKATAIRAFRILGRQFTEEQGLLTSSSKLRRRAIEKAYQQEIDALYQPDD